jgi:hypothetical protein
MFLYWIFGCLLITGGLICGLSLFDKYYPYFEWKTKRMANNIYVKIREKLLTLYRRLVAPAPQVP